MENLRQLLEKHNLSLKKAFGQNFLSDQSLLGEIVQKAQVDGQITAIPSKSYAHRISICNFLAGKKSFVDCGDFNSKDIQATAKCLTALKNGEKVTCYGYYTTVSKVKWLLVATKDGTGFVSSKYLNKM